MKHELLLKWIFSKLNLTREYFEMISSEITKSCNELIKTVKLVSEMFSESYQLEQEYQTKFSQINSKYQKVIGDEISDSDFKQLFAPVLDQMSRSLEYIEQRVEIKSELKNLVGNKENYLINELIRKMKFLKIDQSRVCSQINDYKRDYCEYLNKCITYENEKAFNLKHIRTGRGEAAKVYRQIFVNNKEKSHLDRVKKFEKHPDRELGEVCAEYVRKWRDNANESKQLDRAWWRELRAKIKRIERKRKERYAVERSRIVGNFLKLVEEETEGIKQKSRNINQKLETFFLKLKDLIQKISLNELEWKEKIRSTILKKYYNGRDYGGDTKNTIEDELQKSYFNSNLKNFFENKKIIKEKEYILFELPDSFIDFSSFLKLIENISNSIHNIILEKIQKYELKVPLEDRIFSIFMIKNIFYDISKSTPKNIQNFLTQMDLHDQNSYIQYQFMAHKIFARIQNPRITTQMSENQMTILKKYVAKALNEERKKSKRNIFLMYLHLRFSTHCRSANRDFLSSRLFEIKLLLEYPFWQQMFKFMNKFIYSEPKETPEDKGKDLPKFLIKIEEIFKRKQKINKSGGRTKAKNLTFQAIAEFMSSLGLDFGVGAGILMELSGQYGINSRRLEETIRANKEIWQSQMGRGTGVFETVGDLKKSYMWHKVQIFERCYADLYQEIRFTLIFDSSPMSTKQKKRWADLYLVIKLCIPYLVDFTYIENDDNLNFQLHDGREQMQIVDEIENSYIQSVPKRHNNVFFRSKSEDATSDIQINVYSTLNQTSIQTSMVEESAENQQIFESSKFRKKKKKTPTIVEFMEQNNFTEQITVDSRMIKFEENLKESGVVELRTSSLEEGGDDEPNVDVEGSRNTTTIGNLTPVMVSENPFHIKRNRGGKKFHLETSEDYPINVQNEEERIYIYSDLKLDSASETRDLFQMKNGGGKGRLAIPQNNSNSRINSRKSFDAVASLESVFKLIAQCKAIYAFRFQIMKDILANVVGLTDFQRTHLLIGLSDKIKLNGGLDELDDCLAVLHSENLEREEKKSALESKSQNSKISRTKTIEKSGAKKFKKAAGEGNRSKRSGKSSKKSQNSVGVKPFVVGRAKPLNRRYPPITSNSAKKSKNLKFDFDSSKVVNTDLVTGGLNDILSLENVCSVNSKIKTFESKNSKNQHLGKVYSLSKLPNMIMLDSVRLFSSESRSALQTTKRIELEKFQQIMLNLINPRKGNYDYYFQGLSFIIKYFFKLIKDSEATYRIAIYVIQNNFKQFFTREKSKIQCLLYMMNQLIKIFFPNYALIFPMNQLRSMDIFFESWLSSIFTSFQDEPECLPLIHQVMDIFVAEGWAGFIKVVLVILVRLEAQILKMTKDQKMNFFKDFMRNGLLGLVRSDISNLNNQIYSGVGHTPRAGEGFNLGINSHLRSEVSNVHQDSTNSNNSPSHRTQSGKMFTRRKSKFSLARGKTEVEKQNMNSENKGFVKTNLKVIRVESYDTSYSDQRTPMGVGSFDLKEAVKEFYFVDMRVVSFYVMRYFEQKSKFESEWMEVKKKIKTMKRSETNKKTD